MQIHFCHLLYQKLVQIFILLHSHKKPIKFSWIKCGPKALNQLNILAGRCWISAIKLKHVLNLGLNPIIPTNQLFKIPRSKKIFVIFSYNIKPTF